MASDAPWLTRLARALGLGALEGASVALALWTLRVYRVLPAYARENKLEPDARTGELVHIALGVAASVVLAGVVFMRKRREGLDFLERAVRRFSLLALLGPAALLLDWRLWPGREPVFYTLVLGVGLCVPASLLVAWRAGRLLALEKLRARIGDFSRAVLRRIPRAIDWPLVAALLGAAFYAVYFSAITIENHRNLGTSIDLAIENNLMWNLVHGGPLFGRRPSAGRRVRTSDTTRPSSRTCWPQSTCSRRGPRRCSSCRPRCSAAQPCPCSCTRAGTSRRGSPSSWRTRTSRIRRCTAPTSTTFTTCRSASRSSGGCSTRWNHGGESWRSSQR